jgi:hypothetical protein
MMKHENPPHTSSPPPSSSPPPPPLTTPLHHTRAQDLKKIGDLALELGVELREDAKPEGPAAVAMWLFDGSVEELPGGYARARECPPPTSPH